MEWRIRAHQGIGNGINAITCDPADRHPSGREELVCFNYSGPYGIVTVSCQRSRKPQAASGRIDAATGTGSIVLQRLGKSSFKYKVATNQKGMPQMEIELPREWLRQGAPVLYETSLNPSSN